MFMRRTRVAREGAIFCFFCFGSKFSLVSIEFIFLLLVLGLEKRIGLSIICPLLSVTKDLGLLCVLGAKQRKCSGKALTKQLIEDDEELAAVTGGSGIKGAGGSGIKGKDSRF